MCDSGRTGRFSGRSRESSVVSPVDVNDESVERRKRRLLAAYGDVPVLERRTEVPADEFQEWVTLSHEGYVGSAYALVRRSPEDARELSPSMRVPDVERERVLLILPRGETAWGAPGGGLEGEESFDAAAVREIREETGVECELTALQFLRHDVSVSSGDRPERLHALRAFFAARYAGGTIRIQAGELNGAAWFADPPADLLPETDRLLEPWDQGE